MIKVIAVCRIPYALGIQILQDIHQQPVMWEFDRKSHWEGCSEISDAPTILDNSIV